MWKLFVISAICALSFFATFSFKALAVINGSKVSPSSPIAKSAVAVVHWTTIMGNIPVPIFCSGTLIRPDVVLTAAHCLFEQNGDPVKLSRLEVSFGVKASLETQGEDIRAVIDDKPHSGFHFTPKPGDGKLDDIALLRLSEPAPNGFESAKLPDVNPSLAPRAMVEISGYGITDENDRVMYTAGTLNTTEAPFLFFTHEGSELHLSDRGGGISCYGDSGGPAYTVQGGVVTVFGVNSHGTAEGVCGGDQIFTSVAAHRKFIDSTLQAWPM